MNRDLVLADAGYWHALLNQRDQLHALARAWGTWLLDRSFSLVTTELVMWEVLNANSHPSRRRLALDLYRECDAAGVLIEAPRLVLDEALPLHGARPDKAWSLPDCLSFHLMDELGLGDALSADHHFQQAGFRALLLEELPK